MSLKMNLEFFNLHETIQNAFNVVKHFTQMKKVEMIAPTPGDTDYNIFKSIRGD